MVNVCKHCMRQYISPVKGFTCNACKDIDAMRYAQIRAYLTVYPNSNAVEISQALDIKPYVILKYIDEGRLVVGKGEFEKL